MNTKKEVDAFEREKEKILIQLMVDEATIKSLYQETKDPKAKKALSKLFKIVVRERHHVERAAL